MKPIRNAILLLAIFVACRNTTLAQDPLPSWNDGSAKQAILDFVRVTTASGGEQFVPPAERIATLIRMARSGSNIPSIRSWCIASIACHYS